MPAPQPQITDIHRGMERYDDSTDRPWLQTLNRVDWFIAHNNKLYPLKYTFALAMDIPPASFTTDQMKAAMKHLDLNYHSMKAQIECEDDFQKSVKRSLADPIARQARLQTAKLNPKVHYTYRIVFQRNPDVVAEVLERANGICECCGSSAPFERASDNSPYLEVHHIEFLANGGSDTVSNAEALCPNCHRKKHYGHQDEN